MHIPIADITIPPRKRPLDEGIVQQLEESIRHVGLLHPITLTPQHRLVAGYHRVAAMRLLGETTIPAEVKALDATAMQIATINENLVRNALTAMEFGEQVEARNHLLIAATTASPSTNAACQ